MVDQEAREQVAAANARLGGALKVEVIALDQIREIEKNARYMTNETYRRLVENIERDGCLSSVPLLDRHPDGDGTWRCISGNHRVKAARDAGLTETVCLYFDETLDADRVRALQLSHNALVGQDDRQVLRELYDEIGDLDFKAYTGLDDNLLGALQQPDLKPLSEAVAEFRSVSILFLPEEHDQLEALIDQLIDGAGGDGVYLARFADYDRMLDALTRTKDEADVKNTATAMTLLLELVERNIDQLPQVIEDLGGVSE